jgi:hypothetical protein
MEFDAARPDCTPRKFQVEDCCLLGCCAVVIRAIALLMEARITSEASLNFCQTTRRNNHEVSHLHTRRRENWKYHRIQVAHILLADLMHVFTDLQFWAEEKNDSN